MCISACMCVRVGVLMCARACMCVRAFQSCTCWCACLCVALFKPKAAEFHAMGIKFGTANVNIKDQRSHKDDMLQLSGVECVETADVQVSKARVGLLLKERGPFFPHEIHLEFHGHNHPSTLGRVHETQPWPTAIRSLWQFRPADRHTIVLLEIACTFLNFCQQYVKILPKDGLLGRSVAFHCDS